MPSTIMHCKEKRCLPVLDVFCENFGAASHPCHIILVKNISCHVQARPGQVTSNKESSLWKPRPRISSPSTENQQLMKRVVVGSVSVWVPCLKKQRAVWHRALPCVGSCAGQETCSRAWRRYHHSSPGPHLAQVQAQEAQPQGRSVEEEEEEEEGRGGGTEHTPHRVKKR